jgi:hypothetical protein
MEQSHRDADIYSASRKIKLISLMSWNLSQLRVEVVTSEKLVAETEDVSGAYNKRNSRC